MQPREQIKTIFPMIYLIPTIILVEGFASIAVEIMAIRQLIPFAGGSVIVTSLIIGIFLLFLALGYDWGGRVEKNLHRVLRINFFVSALLVGIGMSYLFVKGFFFTIQTFLHLKIIWTLLFYLFVVLAPTIFLLGQTLPILMNIVRQNRSAGVIAGRALGLSTVGSFLGAVLTTLVLMHYFGIAVTVVVIFTLLMALSIMLCQTRHSLYVTAALAFFAGVLIYILNVYVENKLFVLTTNHANYQVMTHENSMMPEGSKVLVINELFSSYQSSEGRAFEYIEKMRSILFDDLKLRKANILVLGAGGFSLSQSDVGQNHYTYVDIDDQITKAVKPAYLSEIKDKIVFNDARQYLQITKEKYDAIVVDVYSDINAIPSHLLTYQFMQSIKRHLEPKGVVLFNIIARPQFDDVYSKRIDNTIRSVFGSCAIIPVTRWNLTDNILFACQNDVDVSDTKIYTDNLNTSTTDSFNW